MNILFVDDNDKVIGAGPKQAAYEKGISVRISRVFLTNHDGALLIQRRSQHVHLPRRWDQSAAGHVDEGEDYDKAAYRELEEEMGIANITLHPIAKYYTEEHDESFAKKRFNTLYVGEFSGNVRINPEEVSDYRWVMPADLENEMLKNPDNFTEGFRESFIIYNTNTS